MSDHNQPTVDAYLADLPAPQKKELERIRRIIRRTVPDAVETFSYGMPAYKYKSKPLIYFAAFKDHMSLFPTSGPTETLRDKLKGYTISKGTIRFTAEHTIPEKLIKEIIVERLKSI